MNEPLNRNAAVLTEWDEQRLGRLKEAHEAALAKYAETGETTFQFDNLEFNVHFVKHMLPWATKQLELLNGQTDGPCNQRD